LSKTLCSVVHWVD